MLLHHFQHGEDYITVAQWKLAGDVYGKLQFWLWDPGILLFGRLPIFEVVVHSDVEHGLISTQRM